MSITIGQFREVATGFSNAEYSNKTALGKAGDTALVLKGGNLRAKGFFDGKSAHRKTVDAFMQSLVNKYGKNIADSLSRTYRLESLKSSGKPLTVRNVQDILADAGHAKRLSEPLRAGFSAFHELAQSPGKTMFYDSESKSIRFAYGDDPHIQKPANEFFLQCLENHYGDALSEELRGSLWLRINTNQTLTSEAVKYYLAKAERDAAQYDAARPAGQLVNINLEQFEDAATSIVNTAVERAGRELDARGGGVFVVLDSDGSPKSVTSLPSKAATQRTINAFRETLKLRFPSLNLESIDKRLLDLQELGKPLTAKLVNDILGEANRLEVMHQEAQRTARTGGGS